MTMAFKYQVLLCPRPKDILLISFNHIDAIRDFVKDTPGILNQVDETFQQLIEVGSMKWKAVIAFSDRLVHRSLMPPSASCRLIPELSINQATMSFYCTSTSVQFLHYHLVCINCFSRCTRPCQVGTFSWLDKLSWSSFRTCISGWVPFHPICS